MYARGNAGQTLFYDDAAYRYMLQLISEAKRRYRFEVLAFSLMPNHIHLLIKIGSIPIGVIMQQLLTAYSQYFNRTRKRYGHVFQGRFGAKLCRDDRYLATVVRYIHENPVEAGLAKTAAAWPYSSHGAYGAGSEGIVDTEVLYRLLAPDPVEAAAVYQGLAQQPLPPLKDSYLDEAPAFEWDCLQREPLETLAERVLSECSLTLAALRGSSRAAAYVEARRRLAAAAFTEGFSICEIARLLGRDPSVVTRILQRTARTA